MEINLRFANFFKFVSTVAVLISLAYMYAYVTDRIDFMESEQTWHHGISKVHIFYSGLVIFAVFNLLMNLAISMFKNTQGIDKRSILFKSEHQKQNLVVWFTYLLTGGNIFVACLILYLALIKINLVGNTAEYIYLPLSGTLLLTGVLLGLIFQMIRK